VNDLVVTVTPTIMDGTVVRWYRSLAAAEQRAEMLSASGNGVLVRGFLHEVPPEALAQANEAFEILRGNGPRQLVQDMATHRRKLGDRLLMPILRGER
jgi:hypothetical protein